LIDTSRVRGIKVERLCEGMKAERGLSRKIPSRKSSDIGMFDLISIKSQLKSDERCRRQQNLTSTSAGCCCLSSDTTHNNRSSNQFRRVLQTRLHLLMCVRR
jgi:hypothetical protein